MRALYRASFELTSDHPPAQLANEVARDCYRWALDTLAKREITHSFAAPVEAATVELQKLEQNYELESLNASSGDSIAWGLRFAHPDSEDPDVRWIVETTIYSPDGTLCQFSCSIFLARSGESYSPVRRHSSRPRIVRDVLTKYSGKGGFPLSATAFGCPLSDVEFFAGYLQDPKRTHPVLFISPAEAGSGSSLKADTLADYLAGVAYVVAAENNDVTWKLAEIIPNQLNCYGGAARLYWPGFHVSDSPFDHPLWPPRKLSLFRPNSTTVLGQTVLDMVSNVAVFNLHRNFLTWDRLQEISRRIAIAQAKAAGRGDEMLVLFEEENWSLTNRVGQLENQLNELAGEAKKQRSLAENYRVALEDRKLASPEIAHSLPAVTVMEAIENAKREHSEKLAFSFNSKSDHKDSAFLAPDEVERAFNWLATTYYESKTGRRSCPDLDKNLSETITGWHYSGHQKDATVKASEAWYRCPWDGAPGKKLWIREHLRAGTSRRPEETIRIAFAWDPKTELVVIGFIGQHQENTKT